MVTYAEDNPFPYILINESATDGSAVPTPAADYREMFVGEDGLFHLKDSSGTVTTPGGGAVATDAIWDAAGDLAQGTGANTAAKLTLGAAGTVVRSTGSTNAYAYPPGYEFDHVEITSSVNVTATVEASATTIITGNAVTYDGSTTILIIVSSPFIHPDPVLSRFLALHIFDGSTSLGYFAYLPAVASQDESLPFERSLRITPSAAAHTYSVRGTVSAGTGVFAAGAGGAGNNSPAYIRQVKV